MADFVDIPHPDAALDKSGGKISDTWWRALKQIAQRVNSTSSSSGSDGPGLADHIADPTAAHAASAISFAPNGSIAATDVQSAIQEVRDEALSVLTSVGIQSVEEDTNPSLGGNLDLNSKDITGTGNIDIAGSVSVAGDINIDDHTIIYDDASQGTIFRLETATQWTWHDATGGQDRMILDRATGALDVASVETTGNVVIGGTVAITGADPVITLTDTDTSAINRISANNATGSLRLYADLGAGVADSRLYLNVDGVDQVELSSAIAAFAVDASVPDEAYDADAWDGSLEVPTKNAIRDKFESLRELLVADRTYYVRLDGDNGNTGLVNDAGGAWLTLQYAWDTICATLDLGSHAATIKMDDGDYTGDGDFAATVGPVGGFIKIQGNLSDKSAVKLGFCIMFNVGTPACSMHSVTVTGAGIYVFNAGCLWALTDIRYEDGATLSVDAGAQVNLFGPDVGGGATFEWAGASRQGFFLAYPNSFIYDYDTVHTVEDSPALSNVGIFVTGGFVYSGGGTTWTGTTTGVRYSVDLNGVIYTEGGGANFYPGDTPGTTNTGGEYA